jgi:hypothetical protein
MKINWNRVIDLAGERAQYHDSQQGGIVRADIINAYMAGYKQAHEDMTNEPQTEKTKEQ